jgi:hypothetical protein
MLFQPLRMLSDKPPQTTSNGRDMRSSTRYSHYMLKVTSARLASVVRKNVRQDASRLIIDNRRCYRRPDASLRGSAEGWAKPESGGKQK